jgi:trehalose synthase
MMRLGANVVWRCHVGHDGPPNEEVERAWAFLRPYLEGVPYAVFTRKGYAPAWLHEHAIVQPPSLDPFSAKNRPMAEETVRSILVAVGLVAGPAASATPAFSRDDGTTRRIDHAVDTVSCGPPPAWDAPIVTQVSARVVPETPEPAHLVLAGPSLDSVADDPEGTKVFAQVESAWRALPDAQKRVVHLALLPMDDLEENAAIVNALQRHAAVVVQKSLQEGFGLTVTEAMWKRRPVVASAVGGIQDQIRDGVDGILLRSPTDEGEFAAALRQLLTDHALARRIGDAAHERVVQKFLPVSTLLCFAELIDEFYAAAE